MLFLRLRTAFLVLSAAALVLIYRRQVPGFFEGILPMLLPGALLGLTICVRVPGTVSRALVALHALQRHGRRALPLDLQSMWASQPSSCTPRGQYLWPDPLGHFWRASL